MPVLDSSLIAASGTSATTEYSDDGLRRTYKFRLQPTAHQHIALNECLRVHRNLYNAALQERRDAYEVLVKNSPNFYSKGLRPKCLVNFTTQSRQLAEIRAENEEVARFGSHSEQATLRRLDLAFQAFFRRVAIGETPGYPRFKAAQRFNTVTWPKEGNGAKFHPETSRIYLLGTGYVKIKQHRKVQGVVKTVSVKKEGKYWYVILSCDKVPKELLEPTHQVVGLDMGVTNFAVTSDGEFIENPHFSGASAEKIALAQRKLSKKQRDSKNRSKARATLAKAYRKVANQRLDYAHQVANHLVSAYDVIVVEDLNIKQITKNISRTPEDPGVGVAAKSSLNESITDASWGQFLDTLRAKAEKAGRNVVEVNPAYTSQTCFKCRHVAPGNRITQGQFRCRACGHEDHADLNASKNIKGAGLVLLATS